jgi:opacity protein-like surface antigen
MSSRKLLLLSLCLAGTASSLHAQSEYDYGRYEVTPFVGSRFGGNIDLSQQGNPNVDYLKIKNSINYGILGDVTFWQNFQGEFMWNRQATSLTSHNPNDNTFTPVSNMNFDMYQFSVLYQFHYPYSKFRPYAVAGLGFSHYGVSGVNGQSVLGFSNRFAYNLGGGVKYFFNPHWGLRAEVRWSPTHTTSGESVYCDPVFGCAPTTTANKAEQGQANVGIIFRFGR